MGKSIKDPFTGVITHYDDHGKKIGKSTPGILGGYTNYDSEGNKTGRSDRSVFGGYTNYDKNGNRTGSSTPGLFGGYITNSKDGSSYTNTDGCYIATCVYGDYNCSQVWVLRRFRDYVLYEYFLGRLLGRLFIKCYYKISPILIKIFGKKKWFKNLFKSILDKFIIKLKNKGYKDTEYYDRF